MTTWIVCHRIFDHGTVALYAFTLHAARLTRMKHSIRQTQMVGSTAGSDGAGRSPMGFKNNLRNWESET